jgi:fructokinase
MLYVGAMDPCEQVVVGFGELLWDCFPRSRRPGGAPANVAYHAARLGHRGVVVSRVGADPDGETLREHLRRHVLGDEHVQLDPRRPTGTVSVDDSDPSDPRYTIHEDVAWDHIELDAALERLAGEVAAVCFGTLAQRSEPTREALHRFLDRARGALRVYDVNLRQRFWDRARIERSLDAADVVKLNQDEVVTLAGELDAGPGDPRTFARAMRSRHGVGLVCVTRGADGCLLLDDAQEVDLPGRPIEVADSVGAGDAFTAGLISGRLRGWPLERCAHLANELGARVASREGAMPDLRAELDALLARLAAGRAV